MKNVYVVIAFEKNAKGESYANKIIGVYTTLNKAYKTYEGSGKFCIVTKMELNK